MATGAAGRPVHDNGLVPRWRLPLAVLVAGLLAAGAAGLIVHSPDRRAAAPKRPSPTAASSAFTRVPRPGQALIAGTVDSLTADNAEAPPLALPLTITIPNRGQGGATFRDVQVDGRPVAISWYGGQPLPVSGTGSLDLAGAPLTLDASGPTWSLDGAARGLTPGRYFIGAPVAVGAGGLGTATDSVSFDAGPASTVETTGAARVHQAPARLHVEGPGSLTLHGRLALRTPTQTRSVVGLRFGQGDYQLDLSPIAGGYQVEGILQGPLSVTG
jgi:hypothetical protein